LILAISNAIFFLGALGSCSRAHNQRVAHDKEMEMRLDAEEKMSKVQQDKLLLENQSKALSKAQEEEKALHETTKKSLLQEQLLNKSLNEELTKITKLKEVLEEDLKEALLKAKK